MKSASGLYSAQYALLQYNNNIILCMFIQICLEFLSNLSGYAASFPPQQLLLNCWFVIVRSSLLHHYLYQKSQLSALWLIFISFM